MMLMSRGCPQTLDSFELPDSLTSIESQIVELWSRLESFAGDRYIAPEGCEAHRYNERQVPIWKVLVQQTHEQACHI